MSTSYFQETMTGTLGDHLWKDSMVYVDDMYIFTNTYKEHVDVTRDVLTLLKRDNNLKLKKEKCKVCVEAFEVLGFKVSKDG